MSFLFPAFHLIAFWAIALASLLASRKFGKIISTAVLIFLFLVATMGYSLAHGYELTWQLFQIQFVAAIAPLILIWLSSIVIPAHVDWSITLVWSFVGVFISVWIYWVALVASICGITNFCP